MRARSLRSERATATAAKTKRQHRRHAEGRERGVTRLHRRTEPREADGRDARERYEEIGVDLRRVGEERMCHHAEGRDRERQPLCEPEIPEEQVELRCDERADDRENDEHRGPTGDAEWDGREHG